MLRFNFLTAALGLAVLAACTSSGPEGTTPVDSQGRTSMPLVADASTPVNWSGADGGNCLNCRPNADYACVTNTGNDNHIEYLTQTFPDPFPGAVVTGVRAKVYGRLINTPDVTDNDSGKEWLNVKLNGLAIGDSYLSETEVACDESTACATPWEKSYPGDGGVMPNYLRGQNNTLQVGVSGEDGQGDVKYCLSHVELIFTYLPRTLAVTEPADGGLNFGNQQNDTTSAALSVTLENTGDVNVRSITPSIHDEVGGTFTLVGFDGGTFDLASSRTRIFTVTFKPAADGGTDGGVASGILSFISNDTDAGFPANNPRVDFPLFGRGVPFAAQVSPESLTFGAQRVNSTSDAQMVTVRNVGDVPSAYSFDITGVDAGLPFEVTTDAGFPLTVTAGSSVSFPVRFKPTDAGVDQPGTLTIVTTDSRGSIPVSLWGTGVKSTIGLSPDAGLTFESQLVRTPSGYKTVTVSNTGAASLNVSTAVITSGPYEVETDGGFEVAADGGTHSLSVRFIPTAEGNQPGILTVTSDDPDRPTVGFTLSGTGIKPTIVLSPDAGLTFAAHSLNNPNPSDWKPVMVSNPGSSQLNVGSATITSGPFEVMSSAGFPVAADGGTHTLSVRFSPTVEGENQPGTLTVESDDPDKPRVHLPLSGTAIKPTIALNPPSIDFGPQREHTTSGPETVTVSNPGSETLRVDRVDISGPFAVSSAAGFELAPDGGSRPLSVTFSPMGEGSLSGTLTVYSNDPQNPAATVRLSGTGVKPSFSVTPSTSELAPLDFSEQRVNTSSVGRDVTLSNTGSGPITIKTVSVASPFSVNKSGPFTLAGGESTVLLVTFTPTSEGVLPGSLTLTTDYGTSPLTVFLSGKGVKPTVQASPSAIDFGSQTVGTASAAQDLTVSNTGSGTLKITDIQVEGPFKLNSMLSFNLSDAGSTGSSKTLQVTFHPTAQNQATGRILFKTNDPTQSTVTINLAGDGEVLLNVSTDSINFGDVPATSYAERDVTFTNKGTFDITLNTVSTNSDRFELMGFTPPVTLTPANPSKTFKARFSPGTTGPFTGTITVGSTADNSPHSISLLGQGTEATMQITLLNQDQHTTLKFGDVEVNNTKQETVRLTNVGGAPLDMTGAAVVNRLTDGGTAFRYLGSSMYQDIAPDGGFVDFQVAFSPTENTDYSAFLVLTSDAVNSPLELPLLGTGVSARLGLSANRLDFGNQRAGHPSTRTVYIKNEGTALLKIVGFSFTKFDYSISSPETPPSPGAPLVVGVGDTVGVDVVLTPTVTGPVNDNLSISSNAIATDGGTSVTLTGTGLDGLMIVNPIEIIFDGGVEVGASSEARPVRVTNDGGYALKLESATIQNPSEYNPFFISGFPIGLSLEPGASQEFFVTFRPAVNGYQSGTLAIKSDSALNPTRNVTVSGSGVGAEVELLRTSIGFGKANVGTSTSQSISIKNKGVKTLEIYDISFENKSLPDGGTDGGTSGIGDMAQDFSVERTADGGSVFPMWVDAGSFASVPLRFAPTAVGTRLAEGVISSNAKTVRFDVTGEGTSPDLKVEPSELTIDGVLVGTDSAPKSITITNRGSGSISLQSIQLSGSGSAAFTKTHSQVPIRLDPNLSAVVVLTYKPTEEQPVASVQLLVEPDAPGVPSIQVPILGVGVRQPISVESEMDFGQQLVDNTSLPRTLNITNNTDARVTLSDIRVVGTDAIQFTPERLSLPIIMEKGKPVPLKVTFRPRVLADVNAVLRLSFAELTEPLEVALHGKGIPAVLSVNPSPLDFGGVRAVTGVKEEAITLLNLSSDPVTLGLPELRRTTGEPFIFNWASLEGQQLMPGVPLIKKVKYQPAKESFSETVLLFGTTTPLVPGGVEFKMMGVATNSLLRTDVSELDFGRVEKRVTPPVKTVTVTNESDQLQRVVVSLESPQGTPFTVDASALAESIPPKGSATFSVTFAPETSGAVENQVQVSLQGAPIPEVQIPVKGYGQILTGSGSGCACGSTGAGSAALMALLALVGVSARRRWRE